MKRHPRLVLICVLLLVLAVLGVHRAAAQTTARRTATSSAVRAAAREAQALRVVVSIDSRRLWVLSDSGDTLLAAAVAVGSGRTLRAGGNRWTFATPRGIRTVLSKEEDPIWIRPVWAFVEVARSHRLRLDSLSAGHSTTITDGRTLVVRSGRVGIVGTDGTFEVLPIDDEIVFGRTLYIPPIGTENRGMPGTLGRFRLNLGDGIGLHGTDDETSIGRAVTHGCLRLGDDDLQWVYDHVPIGTKVYMY